jgi:hypothetical protein
MFGVDIELKDILLQGETTSESTMYYTTVASVQGKEGWLLSWTEVSERKTTDLERLAL